jgi:hypothetical protein
MVENYLGVAGAMKGAMSCLPFYGLGVCSTVDGMSCNSAFLRDINSKQVYLSTTYCFF